MTRPATIYVKAAKEALVSKIETLIMAIPPGFNAWTHTKAVDFKMAVESAARYAKRKRVTMPALAKHNARLKRFWK